MKRIFVSFLVLVLVALFIIGCGTKKAAGPDKQNQSSGQAKTDQAENLLEKIKKEGFIKIGTEGTYAPFTFHDKSGELTGFDVDIAREVAKRLGVKPEFIETKWDGMFAGLDAKRFDVVANEVAIRDDRKEKYDFSEPYIVSKAVLIVHKDNNDIKKFEDLKGKKSGQSLTSNYADLAKSYGAGVIQTEGFNQAVDLLLSNRIDATINDSLSFLDFKKQRPDSPIKVVDERKDVQKSAFLFRKGNQELVKEVNKILDEMKKDGTYLEISKKWFGEDVSK